MLSVLSRPEVSYTHHWEEGDLIIIDNLAVAHKAAPGAHVKSSGLRILHRTTIQSTHNLDPDPLLQIPSLQFDMCAECPFKGKDVVWEEGYVGFRWGDWQERTVPH